MGAGLPREEAGTAKYISPDKNLYIHPDKTCLCAPACAS
ncbi:hypothetical protein PSN_4191 [Pseudomonas sp. NGC7]